jgi:hypothetical protein
MRNGAQVSKRISQLRYVRGDEKGEGILHACRGMCMCAPDREALDQLLFVVFDQLSCVVSLYFNYKREDRQEDLTGTPSIHSVSKSAIRKARDKGAERGELIKTHDERR